MLGFRREPSRVDRDNGTDDKTSLKSMSRLFDAIANLFQSCLSALTLRWPERGGGGGGGEGSNFSIFPTGFSNFSQRNGKNFSGAPPPPIEQKLTYFSKHENDIQS